MLLIHSKFWREIFQRFEKYGLALALPKCKFASSEVEFLGYKVTHQGITPLSHKIKAIVDFPVPTTQKQLLKFLGMLNFYRKTLPSLQKDGKLIFNWTIFHFAIDWTELKNNLLLGVILFLQLVTLFLPYQPFSICFLV